MKRSMTIDDVFVFLYERYCDQIDSEEDYNRLAIDEILDCATRRSADSTRDFDEIRNALGHWHNARKVPDPAFRHMMGKLISNASFMWFKSLYGM